MFRTIKVLAAILVAISSLASVDNANAAEVNTSILGYDIALSHADVQALDRGETSMSNYVGGIAGTALQVEKLLIVNMDRGFGVHISGTWLLPLIHAVTPILPPPPPKPPGEHHEGPTRGDKH